MLTSNARLAFAVLVAAGACAADEEAPRSSMTATAIAIEAELPMALVAFRDGVDAAWQPAMRTSALRFEAAVHGPYVVAVVCEGLRSEPAGAAGTLTWQLAATLDDPLQIKAPCNAPPVRSAVVGHMVQPGRVQLGTVSAAATRSEWDFQLAIPDGSYDLVATAGTSIAIRRAIAVGGATVLTPPIDVAAQGVPLVDVAFTATNAAPDETVSVSVGLLGPTNRTIPAQIFGGPAATAKAAPDAALVASDIQSVSVRASRGNEFRALRRPFRVGGDAAFALPPPIAGAQWAIEGGQAAVRWTALPDAERFFVTITGSLPSLAPGTFELELTRRFLQATGATDARLDTQIPGYQAAWRIDLKGAYWRQLFAQRGMETDVLTTSWSTEMLNGSGATAMPRAIERTAVGAW